MFLSSSLEERLKKQETFIEELEHAFEILEAQITATYKKMGTSSEELSHLLSQKHKFSKEEWAEILRVKKEVSERLTSPPSGLINPSTAIKNRSSLPRDGSWLHVR